jgi:hypothetical protein
MPTQQEIDNLHNSLLAKAQTIKDKSELAAQKQIALEAKKLEREAAKAAIVSEVANARFEVNNKLQYTNDDQRNSAVIEMLAISIDYQTVQSEVETVTTEKATTESELEFNRKSYRADELLLLYYANNQNATA